MSRVAGLVTLNEFLLLCKTLDEKYGDKIAASANGWSWGGNKFAFSQRSREVKFDVLEVTRDESGLKVVVDLGIEKVSFEWAAGKAA